MKPTRVLCELCCLEDRGTSPCARCKKFCCVMCSLPGIKLDKDGSLLTEVTPCFVEVLCSDCNKPVGGSPCRYLPKAPGGPTGKTLEWEATLV